MKEVSHKKVQKVRKFQNGPKKNLNHPLGLTLSTPSLVCFTSKVHCVVCKCHFNYFPCFSFSRLPFSDQVMFGSDWAEFPTEGNIPWLISWFRNWNPDIWVKNISQRRNFIVICIKCEANLRLNCLLRGKTNNFESRLRLLNLSDYRYKL